MLRLPRLQTKKRELIPLTDTPIQRAMSPPPGRSTLMTPAPWSASNAAAYGPVKAIERSRTRIPSIGPFIWQLPPSTFRRYRLVARPPKLLDPSAPSRCSQSSRDRHQTRRIRVSASRDPEAWGSLAAEIPASRLQRARRVVAGTTLAGAGVRSHRCRPSALSARACSCTADGKSTKPSANRDRCRGCPTTKPGLRCECKGSPVLGRGWLACPSSLRSPQR